MKTSILKTALCFFLFLPFISYAEPEKKEAAPQEMVLLGKPVGELKKGLVKEKEGFKKEADEFLDSGVFEGELEDKKNEVADLFQKIEFTLSQELGLIDDILQTEKEKSEAEKKLLDPIVVAQKMPFLEFDALDEQKIFERDKLRAKKKDRDHLIESLELGKQDWEAREKERRKTKELLDGTDQADSKYTEIKVQAEIAKLKSSLLSYQNNLLELNIELQKRTYDTDRVSYRILLRKVAEARKTVVFSKNDLQGILKELDDDEASLEKSVEKARDELAQIEEKWFRASQKDDEDESKNTEIKRIEKEAARRKVFNLSENLAFVSDQKKMWVWRHKLFNNEATLAEVKEWKKEVEKKLESIPFEYQQIISQISELRKKVGELEADKGLFGSGELKALRNLLSFYDESLERLEKTRPFYYRTLKQIESRQEERSFVAFFSEETKGFFSGAWNYEILSIDDKPISTGKIIIALVLLILGFKASRSLSRFFGTRLFRKWSKDAGAKAAIQAITFYLLILFFTLFAFKVANVPLTIFTLLGGALAIGVGFGSQTLLSNFISGLILLIEQPIRVGDVVSVEGALGEVIKIGARSTQIRTGNDIDILVPNSRFLEKDVANWTLTGDQYRTSIKVGVAYGSPIEKVKILLIQAAETNAHVLKTPEPVLVLSDFGDNALIFELFFSIHLRMQTGKRQVESQVRFKIEQIFRENNIEFSYPQRDIHLDIKKPLEVSLVSKPG